MKEKGVFCPDLKSLRQNGINIIILLAVCCVLTLSSKIVSADWNSTFGATGMNGYVSALAIAPDGALYAVGWFTTANGVSANHVAKWDGSSWSALGTGIDSQCC